MRVLQLCSKPPFPTVDGGTIAMHALTEGLLQAGHTVKVLTVETAKHHLKRDKLPQGYIVKTNVEAVYLDTAIKPLPLATSFFTNKLYIIDRFNSDAFRKRLIGLLTVNEYDVVLLESLFVAPYIDTIRQLSKAKVILRAHNMEYLIWKRVLDNTTNLLKRLYLKHMVSQLKAYEIKAFNKVDGVATISTVDEALVKQLAPGAKVETIPLSTNYSPIISTVAEPYSVFHLGSMDWVPNVEGITWFIHNVWPLVASANPSVKLYLAGRNMPASIFSASNNSVVVEGTVENPVDYMAAKQLMIVPLLSGSGVRVKIIEGMALGKAIVATQTAVEGIAVTNTENIVIANTPTEYATAILNMLNNPAEIKRVGDNAAAYIKANHQPQAVITKLERFITSI